MNIAAIKLDKPDVVDVHSKTAFIYDIWGSLTETRARQTAMSLAKVRNGEAVLEVALGTGLTFLEILKANPDGVNVGIDLTPAMLEKAKLKAAKSGTSNWQIATGDAYALQFPDQHFDLLMNNYMFDLLPEKDFPLVLKEFKRVLKPDGRIVLVNMTRSEYLHRQIWETVYHINPRWLGGCRGVMLLEQIRVAGFMNIHRETVSQFGFPSEIISATVA